MVPSGKISGFKSVHVSGASSFLAARYLTPYIEPELFPASAAETINPQNRDRGTRERDRSDEPISASVMRER